MKCAKCGYVSFDYLSECKKCQNSMASARDGFGFPAGRPAVPSLLGSLLSSYEPPAQQKNAVAETETFPLFNFMEDAGAAFQEKPEIGSAKTASAIAEPDVAEEDFSLLDLSDEELELLIDKDTLGSDDTAEIQPERVVGYSTAKHPPEPRSSSQAAPDLEISPPTGSKAAAEDPDELVFDFDDSPRETEGKTPAKAEPASDELVFNFDGYAEDPVSETKTTPAVELPESVYETAGLAKDAAAPPGLKPEHEQHQMQPGDFTDDLVIDLSENDLDTFFDQLDSNPKGAA